MTHWRKTATALLACGLTAALAGCDESVSRSLGLDRRAPDETRVVEQAPLEIPPDFDLRPPAPGAPRPQERAARDAAAELVLGPEAAEELPAAAPGTPGERSLLEMAGAGDADPAIRAVVNREASVFATDNPGFVDELMFWESSAPAGVTVDAVGEAERLRENAAAGRPATEGDTPVIVPREPGPLESINPF